MLRNVFFVLVLAALAATPAIASPAAAANARKLAHRKAVHTTARATRKGVSRAARGAAVARTHRGSRSGVSRRRQASSTSRVRVVRTMTRTPQLRRASLIRRRIPLPVSPLRGSIESLTRQNERMEADGLERILDEQDLAARIGEKLLVPLPSSSVLVVNTDLTENHRYCRPWTATFLSDFAREHDAAFHKPLVVSSAVRTVEYQAHLMHRNGNAAAAEGDIVSPHLTGGTIDIAKSGMSRKELVWMRDHLLALQTAGLIDVEEEFRQPCFHITVYRSYSPPAEAGTTPAEGTNAAVAGASN